MQVTVNPVNDSFCATFINIQVSKQALQPGAGFFGAGAGIGVCIGVGTGFKQRIDIQAGLQVSKLALYITASTGSGGSSIAQSSPR